MILEPVTPFRPREYAVKVADQAWEQRAAAALRRRVFCQEQGLFQDHDRDALDQHLSLIHI